MDSQAKKCILIVEDEQDLLQYTLRTLISRRRDVYEMVVAVDGYEALRVMHQRPVDCAVLDLNMGNLNGLEVLDSMAADSSLKGVQVVISSGHVDESMELQLKAQGVTHVLKKPYPVNRLIMILDGLFSSASPS